jgi:hypothetical protein
LRTIIAAVLTLVALWSAHVASAAAYSGLMALCADEPVSCCCGGDGDDEAPVQGEQRIESVCCCTLETAPRSNPPAAHACVAQASIRVTPALWARHASIAPSRPAGPQAPSRAWMEMDRLRASPLPGRALVAQKIALLI